VNQPVQLVSAGWFKSPVRKTAARSPTFDPSGLEPPQHGDLLNAALVCDGLSGQPLVDVQIPKSLG